MTEQDARLRLALRSYAAQLGTGNVPPPAETVWLRARQRERHEALNRTAYPLRTMSALTVIAAVLACAWLLCARANAPHDVVWTTSLHSATTKWLLAGFLGALAGWTLLFRATQRLFTA